MRTLTWTRTAAVSAAAALLLAPAAPAFATDTYSPELRQPLPRTATEDDGAAPQEDDCPTVPDDKDGWHFVLPGNKATFVELTVTFEPGGTQTITDFGPPSDKHAYVASEPGAKLTAIEAEVKGGNLKKFNLSHTCPATETGGTDGGTTGETTEGTTGETTEGTTGETTTGETTEGTTGETTTGETTEGTTGETTTGESTEGTTGETTTGESTEGTTGETTTGESTEGTTGEVPNGGGNLADTGSSAPVAALAAAAAALLGAGSYLVVRRRKGVHEA
ncbi:LPXTG cell wall anchor domain-containing protein [Streptomyces carminius]|uniref:LPXTG cell wall anchor domain-containing protein n=1 Tax=Streptomyces carminius TaxID=2665496 RepID=A0A2M8M0S3_9ACTN|nr:LPXTG cell wall anchor domain-containing protein [Streptomyces carminius]PJE97077.1 LPXTG cell wall anchor domain-containing protein [Streptomyces carminius]PJE97786.1 LPXTG cell wall anchor domain-containing protein [Streptomyces carminius]